MTRSPTTADVTHAKSPLAVRQIVAAALGAPVNPYVTWSILREHVLDPSSPLPERLLVVGISALSGTVPEEARSLQALLKELAVHRTGTEVRVALHD